MVLSTALFGKPAFKNLICNGLVLAEDGKKMSKSKQNYPSPMEVIDEYGAVSGVYLKVHGCCSVFTYITDALVCTVSLFCLNLHAFGALKACDCVICLSYFLFAGCFKTVFGEFSSCTCGVSTI